MESVNAQTIEVLDQISDSVAFLDCQWRYTYLNRSAEILFARPKTGLIGQVLWDAAPEMIPPARFPLLERVMRHRVAAKFEEFHAASGRWIETDVFPARGGVILFLRDISSAKLAIEEARWVQNELKRSNEDLRRANRDLETFAYSASHDLQEPLRNVAIFTQLLERRLGGALDEETSRFLNGILGGTRRMEDLVRDVLAYSRATRLADGAVPVVNAGDVLAGVLHNMKARIEQTNAAITFGALPQLSVHPDHLEQLFENLLSNALKFHDPKQSPLVHVSAAQQEGWWVMSVADNGIGIEDQYATQIFGLFKRLHNRESCPGNGVGLAICQRVVEHYGGRIWLERSTHREGSVFSFALPDRRIE